MSPLEPIAFVSLQQAYDWLNGHIDLERQLGRVAYNETTFGLEPFRRRLGGLGDPQRGLRTIHIAGTRGKGSAALALETLLEASGLRTAVFTSPHVREYRERIRLSGRALASARFRELLGRVAAVPGEGDAIPHPTGFKTVFENLTALFFLAASEARADWSVIEVGLGGRLDATNVIDSGPVLLTRIGLEHTRLLGDSIAQIAAEKGATLKPGGWGVVGAQADPELGVAGAHEVFLAQARRVDAPLWRAADLCPLLRAEYHAEGQRLAFGFEGGTLDLDLPLRGTFMAENLQNALGMLVCLRAQGLTPAVPAEKLREGLRRLRLPGRMERVCRVPELIADGAHCPTGAAALADSMAAHFGASGADLLIGMMSDKDHAGFLTAIARWPGWRRVICYRPDHPRAAEPNELAALARRFFGDVKVCERLGEALQFLPCTVEKEHRAVATGTLYSVASLQDWGKERDGARESAVQATTPSDPGGHSGNP